MNPALKDMLNAYRPITPADYQNATREIVQEIALLGLWRGGFSEHASNAHAAERESTPDFAVRRAEGGKEVAKRRKSPDRKAP